MLPLSSGATVCLASNDDKADPLRLMALIRKRKVTVFDTFPSYLRRLGQVLAALPANERELLTDTSLRLILTTSEPLTYAVPHYWRQALGRPVRFINMYGQTETCGIEHDLRRSSRRTGFERDGAGWTILRKRDCSDPEPQL